MRAHTHTHTRTQYTHARTHTIHTHAHTQHTRTHTRKFTSNRHVLPLALVGWLQLAVAPPERRRLIYQQEC